MDRENHKLRIGPSGNSNAFYESGLKHTFEAAKWLNEQGLNAFEYSFGRGVKMNDDTAEKIRANFVTNDVAISAHAPYYTNFANPSADMISSSIRYVTETLYAIKKMGGTRAVVHPASCGKQERADAVLATKRNLVTLYETVQELFGNDGWIVCLETMGKNKQIGTYEEIIDFCTICDGFYPCFDFGHINSYTQGGIKGKDDYKRIIDLCADVLGDKKTRNMHVHFSKIEYSQGGEKRHLTFADNVFGPDYAPLAELIDEYKLTPFVICESDGTMSDDAIIMKKHHKNV